MNILPAPLIRTLIASLLLIVVSVGVASAQPAGSIGVSIRPVMRWCLQADPVNSSSLSIWFGQRYPFARRDETAELLERGFDFDADLFGYDSTVIRVVGNRIDPFHYGVTPLIVRYPTSPYSYDTVHIRVGPDSDPVLRATLEQSDGCR